MTRYLPGDNARRHGPFSTLIFMALTVFATIAISAPICLAGQVRVAVAANFTATMKIIAREFEKKTGDSVGIISGSTGKLYAQIVGGAPFDLFFAADARRPDLLEKTGLAISGSRFTYAFGKLALWSANPDLVDRRAAVLKEGRYRRIAIANPKTAPYGRAAKSVLEYFGLWGKAGIIRGENVGQAYQFAASSNVELALVSYSQVLTGRGASGSVWVVPPGLYQSIEQGAVALVHGVGNKAVKRLVSFVKGKRGRAIINSHGYNMP